MQKAPVKIAVLLACACLSACSETLKLRPEFAVAGIAQPRVTGHASVFMGDEARSTVFVGGPHTFQGAIYRLRAPIGAMAEAIATKVAASYFTGGANAGRIRADAYTVKIGRPYFSYKLSSHYLFAGDITVSVSVPVEVLDPSGRVVVPERKYYRTDFNGTGPHAGQIDFPHDLYDSIEETLNLALADVFREVLDQLPQGLTDVSSAAANR